MAEIIKIIFDFLKSLVQIFVRFMRSKYRYKDKYDGEGFNKEAFIFDVVFVYAVLKIGYKFIVFVIKWCGIGIDHFSNKWLKWFKLFIWFIKWF